MSTEAFEALRQEYATLCSQSGFDEDDRKRAYESGYAKFPQFGEEPMFTDVRINLKTSTLVVTTKEIVIPYAGEQTSVPIGEFAIYIKTWPKDERHFRCINLTRTLLRGTGSGEVARDNHPHVYPEGNLCCSNMDTILTAITDGELLRAAKYILKALQTVNNAAIPGSQLHVWHEAHRRSNMFGPPLTAGIRKD